MRLAGAAAAATGALLVLFALVFGGSQARAAGMMAVQPDGRIVLVGPTLAGDGVVARLESDGGLDRDFGSNGVVRRPFRGPIEAVTVQADGRILAASRGALVRYETDGDLDRSFGEDGRIGLQGFYAVAAVLTLPDGRIVVGGYSPSAPKGSIFGTALAYLYSPDGTWIELLGKGNPISTLAGMTLQGGDRVVMTGWSSLEGGFVARFVPGSGNAYDTTFAGGGIAPVFPTKVASDSMPSSIAPFSGGFFVAGRADGDLALAQLDAGGSPDTTFGKGGMVSVGFDDGLLSTGRDLTRLDDGRILVGGDVAQQGGLAPYESVCRACHGPLVARFLSGGGLDPTFGSNGIARLTEPGGSPVIASGGDIAVAAEGKILIAGLAHDGSNGIVVGRFTSSGSIDPTFGEGGLVALYPCREELVIRTTSSCVPRAMVELRVDRLFRGRPSLDLKVRQPVKWSVVRAVQLRLPPELQFRPRGLRRVRAKFVEPDGRVRWQRLTWTRRVLTARQGFGESQAIAMRLPAGALLRVRKVRRPRRLRFRVGVWAQIGNQTAVRQAFALWRSG